MAMLCLLYLALVGQGSLISAFNLDTSNSIQKRGEPGSLFGFSLAMHWQLSPQDRRLLLVGAPRTKAFPDQKANVTGGLFFCDLTTQQSCNRVIFDNNVDLNSESKENQWMGVSVQSQGPGGKIVTCAHRYEKRLHVNTKQESRDIFGRCYILNQDLTITDDGMDGGGWSFCEGRLRGHEKFGSCQQGVAATFTRDYHYVVFGAPGAFNWKGMVRAEQKNSTLDELFAFEDDGPYEVGGENQIDGNLIPVPANSYLGFSLDTGTGITSLKEMTFVAGAPRANHSGAVLLLKKDAKSRNTLSPEYIIEGEGLASSFGYDVAVVDLNSDGWQDIVVGAPQYFDRDGEIGGAVYIYINKDGKWNSIRPIRLNGTKESMFGISVKNIGDINQDGFPDIAVGAPYDEMGKVFVYHGSQNGINTKPSQIIDGKIYSTPFFGYSVVGNMDLDRNSYPDIAVGSLSDSVYIFRSRPVVSIKKSIIITPDKLDLNKKNCNAPSGICMEVQACFEYEAKPPGYNPGINIGYSFVADSERRRLGLPLRVQFADRPTEHQYNGTLRLERQNQKQCTNIRLQLQENIRDKLRPIPVTVGVEIKQSARRNKRQVGELLPILNSNEPSTVSSEMQFLKEGCGDDNICNSNLKLEYKFCTRESHSDQFSYLQIEKGTPVLVLKNQKDIALEITITNNPSDPLNPKKDGDDAHEAKLIASFPNTLSYSTYRELRSYPEKQLMCAANQNGSQVECELGNPFKRNSNVTFYLILSTSEISVDTTDMDILLKLETTSSQPNLGSVVAKAQVVVELLLSVSGIAKPSQVYFGGTVRGESAMKSEEDIGSLIEYEFRVNNLGRPLKALGTASLDILWPKVINNGKWLLYLMKIDSKGLDKVACQPSDELNQLQLRESHHSRNKRAVGDKSDGGKSFSFFTERKYLKIECNSHAKCVTIRCPLQGLDSSAVLVARSRLWNSTFLEEYSKLNYLDILVNATINVDSAAKNIKVPNAGTQVRVTVFPEKTVALYTGVPWWIILVAILAGILMLALLVFLLWKCGFFKRSNKDQYDATYHKAEIHAQPSDKERLTSDA
ncbi:integrin alpha-6 isoform X2 [Microcaecilia unicolor]|uniref:Integrin alpha-6 isoform X2 n=1 Tax=Microcaecilia unicolor TaxID=1415580 RepID=A0A6P7YT78_9AMPH|nr:integrin alpha-6 isoform X2 [Microcaecilia unicolor]